MRLRLHRTVLGHQPGRGSRKSDDVKYDHAIRYEDTVVLQDLPDPVTDQGTSSIRRDTDSVRKNNIRLQNVKASFITRASRGANKWLKRERKSSFSLYSTTLRSEAVNLLLYTTIILLARFVLTTATVGKPAVVVSTFARYLSPFVFHSSRFARQFSFHCEERLPHEHKAEEEKANYLCS